MNYSNSLVIGTKVHQNLHTFRACENPKQSFLAHVPLGGHETVTEAVICGVPTSAPLVPWPCCPRGTILCFQKSSVAIPSLWAKGSLLKDIEMAIKKKAWRIPGVILSFDRPVGTPLGSTPTCTKQQMRLPSLHSCPLPLWRRHLVSICPSHPDCDLHVSSQLFPPNPKAGSLWSISCACWHSGSCFQRQTG